MDFNLSSNNLWTNRKPTTNPLAATPSYIDTVNNKRYFASNDAEIYFENTFIDDVVQISFQMQQNTMPLYGYNSYVYDDLAVGARSVSGQFVINFTQGNYLYNVLQTLSGVAQSSDRTKNSIWNHRFNIIVHYGTKNHVDVTGSTELFLTGVQLTGCSQILGSTGDPVLEVYPFIAQDIQPTVVTASTTATTSTAATKTAASIISNLFLSYVETNADNKVVGNIGVQYESDYDIKKLVINFKKGDYQTPITLDTNGKKSFSYVVPDKLKDAIRKLSTDYKKIPVDVTTYYEKDNKMVPSNPVSNTINISIILNN